MPIGRARPRGVSTSLDTSGIRGQMRAMIYLDYQATTPLAPEARGAMLRWLEGTGEGDGFANPASTHKGGRAAAAAVEVRSEECRVGKECVSTCKSRGAPEHAKKIIDAIAKSQPQDNVNTP